MADRQRVLLHVGSPKTGTTYLQGILWKHRDLLREQGVLLPLGSLADHYAGTFAVTGWGQHQRGPEPGWVEGAWDRLVEPALAWRGDVLISHEMYCRATAEQAQAAIAPFVEAGREVHVVLTARDLARQLPAAWQEHVKTGGRATFAEFVDYVADPARHPRGRGFWRAHDTASLAERWGSTLPPEHIHIVTVPPSGAPRDLLWRRFAAVLGVEDSGFDLGTYANESLRVEQVELLRRVNVVLRGRIVWPEPYASVVKRGLAETILGARGGTPITLGSHDRTVVAPRATTIVDALRERKVDVAGSLEELRVTASGDDVPSSARAVVVDDRLLDEALAAMAALLEREGREERERHGWGERMAPLVRLRQSLARWI